jgi:hypothetical protein
MKTIPALSLLFLVLRPVTAGGWLDTCGGYDMYEQGTLLYAACPDGYGDPPSQSYLDLNTCLVNINGVIHWEPNGGFGASCSYAGDLCWNCSNGQGGNVYQCPPLSMPLLPPTNTSLGFYCCDAIAVLFSARVLPLMHDR